MDTLNDPLDNSALAYGDGVDDIDWEEIVATTQDDFSAGRFALNSADYPSEEAFQEALKNWLDAIFEEALRETASRDSLHAASL